MRKIILVSSLVLFLVSCKEISGTLEVTQAFNAVINNKCGWSPFSKCASTKRVSIPVGTYNSVVDFSSKTEIKIEMKANAYKETIVLKRPKNFEFPQNGPFQLSRTEVSQDFDIVGKVMTTIWDSPLERQNESCTYTVPDWVCSPDGKGNPRCGYQDRTVRGYRYVEFYNHNTTREMYAELVDTQTLARFAGAKTDSEKVYRYTSICR